MMPSLQYYLLWIELQVLTHCALQCPLKCERHAACRPLIYCRLAICSRNYHLKVYLGAYEIPGLLRFTSLSCGTL